MANSDLETLDFASVCTTYFRVAAEEIAYRGLSILPGDALIDTIKVCACIIGKGIDNIEEFYMLMAGIKKISPHVIQGKFSGEIASEQACKVMYLAASLLAGQPYKVIVHQEQYIQEIISQKGYWKLNHMKKQKLEAYAYLVEAVKLLEE